MVRKVVRRKKLHKMNQKLRIIFMAIAVLLKGGRPGLHKGSAQF